MLRLSLTIFCGVASFALFFAPSEWTRDVFTEFETIRLIIFALFFGLIFSYLRKKHAEKIFASIKKMPKSAKILATAVPLVVLAVVALQIFFPEFAVFLIRDENPGWNYRRGIFIKAGFQLIAAIIFAILAAKFFKNKQKFAGIIAIFLALVLVVMVGEELSWGQRIFRWETPESYAAINHQGETNLHNLATIEFQTVLYSGCWILLVALPFFAKQFKNFAKKFAITRPLEFFLPPAYFLLIFAPAFALGDPIISDSGISLGPIMFYTFATLAISLYLIVFSRGRIAEKISLSLGVFLIALFLNLFVSRITEFNPGAATEYLEMFINFGILYWAVYVKQNFAKNLAAIGSQHNSKPSQKRIAK